MSVISFSLFVFFIVRKQSAPPGSLADARQEGDLDGLAKVAEAFGKLVDSLSKAGAPALTMAAAMFFIVVGTSNYGVRAGV